MSRGSRARPDDVWATLADRHRGPLRRLLAARPWIADAVVVAAYLGFAGVPLLVLADQENAWLVRGAALATVVAAAALAVRRRRPRVVLVVVLAADVAFFLLGAPMAVPGLGTMLALYAVGRTFAPSHAQALGLLCAAAESAAAVFLAARTAWDQTTASAMIVSVGLLIGVLVVGNVAAVGLGSALRSAELHEAELESWARRAQQLARGSERNRIAGEMHDIVAHSLSVMIALSDGARRVSAKDPERAAEVMGDVSRTGRRALADLRRSLGVLRAEGSEAPLGPAGDAASVQEMLDGFRAAGLPLDVDLDGELPTDPAQRLTVVRIIQESLTNALRYARAPRRVAVRLASSAQGVRITVEDDGLDSTRHPRSHGSGIGLAGLHERAGLFGGSVSAGPLPQGGWGVSAWVPHPTDPVPDAGGSPPTGDVTPWGRPMAPTWPSGGATGHGPGHAPGPAPEEDGRVSRPRGVGQDGTDEAGVMGAPDATGTEEAR